MLATQDDGTGGNSQSPQVRAGVVEPGFDESAAGTPIYRLEIISDKITGKIGRMVVLNP